MITIMQMQIFLFRESQCFADLNKISWQKYNKNICWSNEGSRYHWCGYLNG